MNDPYKLYRVMLIGLIGIVCSVTLNGCGIVKKMIGSSEGPCNVLTVNPSNKTVSVMFDGNLDWDDNFPPGHLWNKRGLDDGSEHVIVVYTKDPGIFYKKYTVRVIAGKVFAYGDNGDTGNAIVRIGGSVSSAALTPESPDLR